MGQYLVAADDDFQCNQNDDYLLKSQGSLRVDDVGERLRGVRDHGQFSGQKVRAFLQFVFIFEPGVEFLEVGSLPKNVRLFRHRHETGNAMLNEQCIADVLENCTTAAVCGLALPVRVRAVR